MPFSKENRHVTWSIVFIAVGVLLFGAGIQFALAQDARETQDEKDRAYADCLTDFAADLVNTLKVARDANSELNAARDRKDKALDRLIVITAMAQASGAKTEEDLPPGLLRRYEAVLAERVAAQKAYNQANRRYIKSGQNNPLISPRVVCSR